MRIGAHVSAAGSLQSAMDRAHTIGAECAQLFLGAPQRWATPTYSDADVSAYNARVAELGIGPNVVHALYLVNLASSDDALRQRSIDALCAQMQLCGRLGIMGLIVHVGSSRGALDPEDCIELVSEGIQQVLRSSRTTRFLIENTAGMGWSIGSSFQDIGRIIEMLGGDPRMGVCLDTAHTFEAGYDIGTRSGLDQVFEEFDRHIGLERLAAIHANDSKTKLSSNVDRHENIGRGFMGEEAFGSFMTHVAVRELPFYLEVPGMDGKGPDRENIDLLRRLAGMEPPAPPGPAGAATGPAPPAPIGGARRPRRSSRGSRVDSTTDSPQTSAGTE